MKKSRRGAEIVDAVMKATVEELARSGYGGLSIDAVSERARVNKTTIYRRWPTRAVLVRAVLLEHISREYEVPDSGELARDLFALARTIRDDLASSEGRAVVLALTADDPAVCKLAHAIRQEATLSSMQIIERAIKREELPANVDSRLLLEAVFGPLQSRLVLENEPAGDVYLRKLIAFAIAGSKHLKG